MRKLSIAMLTVATFGVLDVAAMAGTMLPASAPPIPNVTIVPPLPEDLAAAYPAWAKGRNVPGTVLLICKIRSDDGTHCTVGQWSAGFDQAGLQIGQKLRIKSNDAASHAGESFNLRIKFPADAQTESTGEPASPPLPVIGEMTAALPMMPAPSPPRANSQKPDENFPVLVPVNGRAYDVDKSHEPWVVTFHLIGSARVMTCNDKDPEAVPAGGVKPDDTMSVAKNQQLELFETMISSWSNVSGANRCPGTFGYTP